jgi:hypothetical protein
MNDKSSEGTTPQAERMQPNDKRKGTRHALEHERSLACIGPPRCARAVAPVETPD